MHLDRFHKVLDGRALAFLGVAKKNILHREPEGCSLGEHPATVNFH